MTEKEFETKHPQLAKQIKRDHEFRGLSNFVVSECNEGEQTTFQVVVNPNGGAYCHVLGRDSKTIDFDLHLKP